MAMGTWILLAFALAGAFWLGKNAVRQLQNWEALRSDGSETAGNVTGMETGKSQMVYYAFSVNGISFTGKARVPEQNLQGLQDSSPLTIRYVPANPAVNHPADWESAPLESVWFMVPLPLILFSIIFLTSLSMERRLVADGVPAAGVISESGHGSRSGYFADYEFRTGDGKVMKKRVGVPRPLEVGSNILVLYLRQNPRRSQPYPSPNYRVAE
jgi:hypothetical protein